jgi:hypothetical protein
MKQCRRSSLTVPEMLLPATPIVDMTQVTQVDKAMEVAEKQMDNMTVEEVWAF